MNYIPELEETPFLDITNLSLFTESFANLSS
jgi:hypothetical protein